jgi:hypothetical protein
VVDVAHELSPQIRDAGEDASSDDVAFDLGKPYFDLVEPGRVSRREVEVDGRVSIQEFGDLHGFVRRQVIGDDVDLLGRRLVYDDVCQEGDELRRGCGAPRFSPAPLFRPLC